jgi:hypothetical protein
MAYIIADLVFAVDLVLNFFTTVIDKETDEEIVDRKLIACEYLTSWFSVDFLSIVPFETIMELFVGH